MYIYGTPAKPSLHKYIQKVFNAVFRIRFILMRIRIRGSASGIMDPDPTKNRTNSNSFFLFHFCKRFKTHNDVFFL